MTDNTQFALEQSLKNLLVKYPLNQITVKDLVNSCNISRSSFYYHFNCIDDLVEWSLKNDFLKTIDGKYNVSTWQIGLTKVMEELYRDKDFIYNIFNYMDMRIIQKYLFKWTENILKTSIEESCVGLNVSNEDKLFVTKLYSYSFMGTVVDWITKGMKEPIPRVVSKLSISLKGSFRKSLTALAK